MFRKKIMALFFILSILLMGSQIAWAENIDNMEDSEKEYSSTQASVENMESETGVETEEVVLSMSVDKISVTAGQNITITLQMRQGYEAKWLYLHRPITGKNEIVSLYLKDKENNIYAGIFKVDDQTESGMWQVEYLTYSDDAQLYVYLYNSSTYTGTQYATIDFSKLNFEVSGTNADVAAPIVVDYSIDTTYISVDEQVKISITIEEEHPRSNIEIWYDTPSGKTYIVNLTKFSDSLTYEGYFSAEQDTEIGLWTPRLMDIFDANFNGGYIYNAATYPSINNAIDMSPLNFEVGEVHNWNSFYTVDKKATCKEVGIKSIHCIDCAKTKNPVEIPIDKNAHRYGEWITDETPTCTNVKSRYKICSLCGYKMMDTIPSAGHTVVIDEAVEPGCTTTGLTEGSHCSVCHIVLRPQEIVAAVGHTEVIDEAVPATEKENGLTEGSHCSACGKILVRQKVIPSILQYNESECYYEVNPNASNTISNAITLESGQNYNRVYDSSSYHSRKWYSKFTIDHNTYAYISFLANHYYEFSILDENGLTVYDYGSLNKYSGYFPLKAGTYYILLNNDRYSSNSVVLSYMLSETVSCECEPNDTFSTATEIQPDQEYLIFSGRNGNQDYLSFKASVCTKVKIIVNNYEDAEPYMRLYEEDRNKNYEIDLKYDKNIDNYYYEFDPKYNGIYYIKTCSYKAEKIYSIIVQYSQELGKHLYGPWKVVEESTTTINGVERRDCQYCDVYETRTRGLCMWKIDKNGWWYQLPDDTYLQNCWKEDNNKWYHFNAKGYMDTGWLKVNNGWYYLATSGAMQTGWVFDNNTWYYMNTNGEMLTGWLQIGNNWYYLAANGAMRTGWILVDNTWYYMDINGEMLTGWQQINDVWYYFADNGKMAADTWIGNWYVDASGAWADSI